MGIFGAHGRCCRAYGPLELGPTLDKLPRFDGYLLGLARKQAERHYHRALGHLVLGVLSAGAFIALMIAHFSAWGYLPGFGLFFSIALILGGGDTLTATIARLNADLPDHLTRAEKDSLRAAFNRHHPKRRHITPVAAAFHCKIEILWLCRLLAVVAILMVIVGAFALDQARERQRFAENPHLTDPNLMLASTRGSGEYWIRYNDGSAHGVWYGVGP